MNILHRKTFYTRQPFEAKDKTEAQQLAEEFLGKLCGTDGGMYRIPSLEKVVEMKG